MSDFKAKMYQIQFRLGLCPRSCWGSLQHSPRSPSWIKGPTSKGRGGKGRERNWKEGEGRGPTSKGRRGEEREEKGGEGMEWEGKGGKRRGKGEGGEGREERNGQTNPKPAATGLRFVSL